MTRFENSTSISSDDYFGNGTSNANRGNNQAGYNLSSYAPDMAFLKQDLKDGVSRVAGRLSSMASNVMTQFQV
jgi:ADP-ribosylation factor GTPase-activating protein 2/3